LLDPEPTAAETYGSFDTQTRHCSYLSQEPPEEGSGQRCRELERQVAALRQVRAHLAAENRALRARLEGGAAEKLRRLQAQVEELREEKARLESGREELQARCERLELEARGLRDETELLR
ncbi:hypothetical protein DV515_00019353, partial [Chloebia gouldiae]